MSKEDFVDHVIRLVAIPAMRKTLIKHLLAKRDSLE